MKDGAEKGKRRPKPSPCFAALLGPGAPPDEVETPSKVVSVSVRTSRPPLPPRPLPRERAPSTLGPKSASVSPEDSLASPVSAGGWDQCRAAQCHSGANSTRGTSTSGPGPDSAASSGKAAASWPAVLTQREGPAQDLSSLPPHLNVA